LKCNNEFDDVGLVRFLPSLFCHAWKQSGLHLNNRIQPLETLCGIEFEITIIEFPDGVLTKKDSHLVQLKRGILWF
jgi:hypothetical protein